jgi:hypothetical protein
MIRQLFACAVAMVLARSVTAGEPIRVYAKNPRYFEWNGKVVCLVTSAEHYGAVINLDFDYEKYLDTLKADGMPYTRIFAGSYIEPPGAFGIERNALAPAAGKFLAPWKRSDIPGYAGGGNKFDLDQWDPKYLERLKAVLAAASKKSIIVELTFFCSTYSNRQWAVSPFNPGNTTTKLRCDDWKKLNTLDNGDVLARQLALTRYLVRELNGFDNLTYEIQNEPWSDNHELGEILNLHLLDRTGFPNRVEVTKREAVAWQAKIVEAIREEERTLPNKHLVFQNVANFRLAVKPETDLASGINAINFHYAHPEAVTWNESLRMPICCDETGFAGPAHEVYRKQAWSFVTAGGGLWNHLDYSFSVGREDGTDTQPKSPGSGGPVLRKQLRVLGQFVNGFDLAELTPDRQTVTGSPGATAQCLSTKGKQYAVYLRGRGPVAVTLRLPASDYTVEWLDVETGRVVKSAAARSTGATTSLDSPDFKEELALRVLLAQGR